MIAPEGDLWLGKVPWDNTYRNVYYEGMMNKALIVSSFCDLHTTSYSYIPKNGVIRIPYNADELIGYNYCVYQNNNQLFCAFVTDIKYVANGTTALSVQEDVWHTWGGAMVVKNCMVERHHVTVDNLGQWRAPEPALELENVVINNRLLSDTGRDIIVVGTNAIPHLKSGVSGNIFQPHPETSFDGSDAVAGGLYNSVYSGVKYYGFMLGDSSVTDFLDNLNKCGAAESICALFMVSSLFFSLNASHELAVRDVDIVSTSNAPQVHGSSYTPRNKKCFVYPYSYAVISDMNGGSMDVKYEDCNTWGAVKYEREAVLDPTSPTMLHLVDYQGNAVDYGSYMPIDQSPQCAWTYAAYQNWMAQNAGLENNKMAINILKTLGGLAVAGVGVALMASGVGAPAGGVIGELGLGITGVQAAGAGMALSGVGSAFGGAMAESQRLEGIGYQQKQPNVMRGAASANTLQGLAVNRGAITHVGLEWQSARRLDWFFDVFGYQIDLVTVPNLTGRPSWNYVKTVGASMGGAIPRDRMATINGCLDRGITFWHTVDVGNYGLNNTLS